MVLGQLRITHAPRPPLSVSPSRGIDTGGTQVTITGQGFLPGASVLFGGTPATDVRFVNTWTLTAITPAHAAGSVDVVVIVNGETRSMTRAFTYVLNASKIMAIVKSLLE